MQYIDVQQNIDSAPLSLFHYKVLFWCFLIIVIDGYDIAIAGAALPSIMSDMGVTAATAGFMASSAMFGMMFGAISGGILSEKIGRVKTIVICVFIFSLFTALAGFSHDPVTFSILRFIAGLGIGGVLPNIIAQMTEFSPKKLRSFLTTLMFSGYAVGGILAALIGKQFIAQFGWQIVFFVAAAPLVTIPFLLKFMPESISYLMKKDSDHEIKNTLKHINPAIDMHPEAKITKLEVSASTAAPVTRLFQDGRGLSTLMFWVAYFTGLFMMYALSTWLTKLMSMSGYSLGSALSFVVALNVGAVIGANLGGWLADKFNIKWVLVVMYALGSIFLYGMTFKLSTELLYVLIACVGACTTGAQLIAYAYTGQFYPGDIRSTGIGAASSVGRLGAICAPLIIGYIVMLNLPLEQNFMVIAMAGIVGAVALAFINHHKSANQ
ncbi:MFS transporter [Acinetobacter rudis]|uniref:MFS transporter, AAHS family, benzoate transporter n=3 Tax=Acinetobacter rudis TaxID=632955 RepID=S3N6T0_9GAMM|nr:MFS transporter [Acinetobacter rudis]EPF75567.1 MFS transporter, AAHS family, benzoate transporter [Acinetobacter rudis CIP 110305]